jgi:hypothetical protein
LREALARADYDFTVSDTSKSRKSRASRPAPKRSGRIMGFVRQRSGRIVGMAAVTGLLTGIIVNAAFLQTARHPAPLFAAAPPAATPAIPVPAPRPREMVQAPAVTEPAPVPAATPLAPPVAMPTALPIARPAMTAHENPVAIHAPKRDVIAALLRGDAPATVEPSPKVASVQRALQKAGFVVKTDGVFGATTRQALARYERDRNLPVTSDLSARTLHDLAAQTGIAIP